MKGMMDRCWKQLSLTIVFVGLAMMAHAQPFIDACFTSPTVGTSFAGTANVTNRDADLLRWTGSAWVGFWPMANVTIPPPGSIVNSRAIWSGDGTVWTTGGEGFGLRLSSPIVAGTTYTFAFQRVSHGFGQNGSFAPILYTNTGGSFGTSYGAIPAVGTAWSNTNISFTATGSSAGHTFVYFHNNVGSGLFLGCTTVILPMAFSELNAFPVGTDVRVQWRVQEETNYAWHVVERSTDGTDFSEVGREPSAHAGPEGHGYAFEDVSPVTQAHERLYYRIRSIDNEGLEALSPVVETSLKGSTSFGVEVSPNPISTTRNAVVHFHCLEAGPATYTLTDLEGRAILSGNWDVQVGNRQEFLPIMGLPAGIYALSVRTAGLMGFCRLVVL